MIKQTLVIGVALIGFATANANEAVDPLTVYSQENALQLRAEYEEDMRLMLQEQEALDELAVPMTEIQQRRPGQGDHRVRPPRHNDNRGRVRHRPPRRPIPIPLPIPHRQYTCFARNARGQLFSATSTQRSIAQRRAMQRCDRSSAVCRPAGCRIR